MENYIISFIAFMFIIFLVSPNTFASSTSAEQKEEKNNEVNFNCHIEIIVGTNLPKKEKY